MGKIKIFNLQENDCLIINGRAYIIADDGFDDLEIIEVIKTETGVYGLTDSFSEFKLTDYQETVAIKVLHELEKSIQDEQE